MDHVDIPKRALFKAAEVCELAKLQPYVLRSWEAEFPALGVAKGVGVATGVGVGTRVATGVGSGRSTRPSHEAQIPTLAVRAELSAASSSAAWTLGVS